MHERFKGTIQGMCCRIFGVGPRVAGYSSSLWLGAADVTRHTDLTRPKTGRKVDKGRT